jgi:aminoglycoside 6'-N-acetyltransferase I
MTDNKAIIRPLRDGDIDEWLRLRKCLWDVTPDEEHRDEMRDIYHHPETQLVLVAEMEDGHLAGFLEASIRPFVEDCHTDHVGYLEGWFVETEYRRHGIGAELVQAAEDWAREKGCTEMASDTEMGNELSLAVHKRFGYAETSRLIHLRKDLD